MATTILQKILMISNNVEICGIVVAILKMARGRNFSMLENQFGTSLSTHISNQNGHHNTAKIQHCSISKVVFNLFFKPVVCGWFGRLHNR
jgi:hypothetical protein